MSSNLITRAEYMSHCGDADASDWHHRYYAQFITPETGEFIRSRIGLAKLRKSKDRHFNDIGIKHSHGGAGTWVWDFAPVNVEAMREAGECGVHSLPSPSSRTCVAKACARNLLKGETP